MNSIYQKKTIFFLIFQGERLHFINKTRENSRNDRKGFQKKRLTSHFARFVRLFEIIDICPPIQAYYYIENSLLRTDYT